MPLHCPVPRASNQGPLRVFSPLPPTKQVGERELRQLLQALDLRRDGVIQYDEFLAGELSLVLASAWATQPRSLHERCCRSRARAWAAHAAVPFPFVPLPHCSLPGEQAPDGGPPARRLLFLRPPGAGRHHAGRRGTGGQAGGVEVAGVVLGSACMAMAGRQAAPSVAQAHQAAAPLAARHPLPPTGAARCRDGCQRSRAPHGCSSLQRRRHPRGLAQGGLRQWFPAQPWCGAARSQ